MKVNKYKNGIDFTFATFALRLPWMRDYTRFLVDSIHKYTKDIPYKIYIVYNYVTDECVEKNRILSNFSDGKTEYEALEEMFGNDENVVLIPGVNQSDTTRIDNDGSWFQDSGTFPGSIDKCPVRAPSKYHSEGLTIGAKAGKQKYICYLDPDCVFVNDWTEELLPLLEKYFYISNRWDPGTMFFNSEKPQPRSDRTLTESELGRGCPQFMIMKRESCENNKLWPDISYRDVGANITWFAQTKDLPFMCLKNSYWWTHWKSHRGVSWDNIKDHAVHPENNILKFDKSKNYEDHIQNVGYTHEEAFLPTDGNSVGKSFWVHQVKHGVRPRNQNDHWIKTISKILYGETDKKEHMTKDEFEKHLQTLTDEITNEAKLLVNDYKDNPSEESGSVVQIHEKSPYLSSRRERLIKLSNVKLKTD